ncbi:hypothetical protein niasHS_012612 [Heterodera schachtii]|uniref:Pseudouridine synthase RsuA/RluA-like domain-containing protein n=1 Tax=Heterodera schachtii TaxID=97005 RepID=A0ABD2ICS5_HETSC
MSSSSSACEQNSFSIDQTNKTTGTKRTRTIEIIAVAEEVTDKNEEKVDNTFDKKKRKSAKQRVSVPTNLVPSTAENGTEEKGKQKRNQKQGQVEFDYEMRRVLPPQNLAVTVKNGVRYLQPYWGLFCGYSKRRWIGKTIAEVYATEFNNLLHPLYAQAACRKGRIFVNSRPIFSADHRIRDNEYFLHINHRHETEIPHLPIQILAETDDILVLNKPAGLPVHPCGNYALHSVLGLLRREYGRDKDEVLTCLYRLDRTTTGLLMFAKNTEYDKQFKKLVRERKLVKEYVCKVEGRFPDGEIICGKKN